MPSCSGEFWFGSARVTRLCGGGIRSAISVSFHFGECLDFGAMVIYSRFELGHVVSWCGTFIGGLSQWIINSKLGHGVSQCGALCRGWLHLDWNWPILRLSLVSKILTSVIFFPTGIGEQGMVLRECEGIVDLDWQLSTSCLVDVVVLSIRNSQIFNNECTCSQLQVPKTCSQF